MENLMEQLSQLIQSLPQSPPMWFVITSNVVVLLLIIIARRFIIFLNAIIMGAILMGSIGASVGGISAFLGCTVSIAATNKFVSTDVGYLVGGLEGLVVSTIATALVIMAIAAALIVIGGIFSAVTTGIGTPIYDTKGDVKMWIGAPGPSIVFGGCAIPLVVALFAAPVVGVIVGVKINQGEVVDQNSIINIAGLICVSLGALAGLICGGIWGANIGKTTTGGCLVGLVYGLLLGWSIRGGWLELLTGAIIGAIIGSLLAMGGKKKSSESKV